MRHRPYGAGVYRLAERHDCPESGFWRERPDTALAAQPPERDVLPLGCNSVDLGEPDE